MHKIYEAKELKKLLIGYNKKIQNETKKLKGNNENKIKEIINKYTTDFYSKYSIEINNLDFLFKGSSIKYVIDIKSDKIKSMRGTFLDTTELKFIPKIDSLSIENLDLCFANCIAANYYNDFNIPNAKTMTATFINNKNLIKVPFNINKLNKIENLNLTFKNSGISSLGINSNKIYLPNVINMQETFFNTKLSGNFEIEVSNLLKNEHIFDKKVNYNIIRKNNNSFIANIKTSKNDINSIYIYIDGSRLEKEKYGPGGYAGLLRTNFNNKNVEKIVYGSSLQATNNQMELMALISSLETIKRRAKLFIYSDSEYLVKNINERLTKWKKFNWKNYMGETIKNVDLWKKIAELLQKHIIAEVKWVKAHNNIYENELVDTIARIEANNAKLKLKKDLKYKIN